MSKAFSVFVDIGGKVNPSLASSVGAAKTQVNGLAASMASIGARINAPFAAANRHLAETSKRLAKVQRQGRNLAMTVTAPAAFLGASMFRPALERDKAGNSYEAIGGGTHAERLEAVQFLPRFATRAGGRIASNGSISEASSISTATTPPNPQARPTPASGHVAQFATISGWACRVQKVCQCFSGHQSRPSSEKAGS